MTKFIFTFFLSLLLSSLGISQIDLTEMSDPDRTYIKLRKWSWGFAAVQERFPPLPAIPGGTSQIWYDDGNWRMNISSPAVTPNGTKLLNFHIQHYNLPVGHNQLDGGQTNITISTPAISRPAQGEAPIKQEIVWWSGHPTRHYDIIHIKFTVPDNGNAEITLKARHNKTRGQVNIIKGGVGVNNTGGWITLFGSYPGQPDRQVGERTRVRRGRETKIPIPEIIVEEETILPTDYRIRYESSFSETTLSFIAHPADTGGVYREIPLTFGIEFFEDDLAFEAPLLLNDSIDLYYAVNLTEWLGLSGTYNINDQYYFDQGLSNELPGILAGTSPIHFNESSGFVNLDPFTGYVNADTTIIGEVPEKSFDVIIMIIGLLLVLITVSYIIIRRIINPT